MPTDELERTERVPKMAEPPPPPPPPVAAAPPPERVAITVEVIHGSRKSESKFVDQVLSRKIP